MRYISLAFVLALVIGSCSKNDLGNGHGPSKDSLPATTYLNVSYGADGLEKMDVYLPAFRNLKTRTLIIIHGGGWTAGDKADFNSYITEFQKRLPGYAFANLNYRLVTQSGNYFPTQENDIKTATELLKNKAQDYNISTDFIFLGISAGAHLAMLQGYKHHEVVQPKGIVSFFGPVDLQELYKNSDSTIPVILQTIMNATMDVNPDIFAESSPINFVTSHSPPTLMLHGDKDRLVPIEQAYMLRNKLEYLGVTNKLVVYPGQGHGWIGDDLADSFRQVEAFIKGLEN
jgi:acetyl esterase/lipase